LLVDFLLDAGFEIALPAGLGNALQSGADNGLYKKQGTEIV